MPVTKRTHDFLNVRSMFVSGIGALVRFNRPHRQVALTWLAGIIPIRRVVLPLDEISGAQVRKVERNNGRISYGVVLRRRYSSDDLTFACASRDDAMTVMREISNFLDFSPDDSGAAAPGQATSQAGRA